MHVRPFSLIAALALTATLLSGCGGEPQPVETTAPFASEDEAFAAAEATYRAYVDALNAVDLSDPETFEPVFGLTTGELNGEDREMLSGMHADGLSVNGDSVIVTSKGRSFTAKAGEIELDVCLDVSSVDVTREDGTSIVDESRSDLQTTVVTLTFDNTANSLMLEKIQSAETGTACGG